MHLLFLNIYRSHTLTRVLHDMIRLCGALLIMDLILPAFPVPFPLQLWTRYFRQSSLKSYYQKLNKRFLSTV